MTDERIEKFDLNEPEPKPLEARVWLYRRADGTVRTIVSGPDAHRIGGVEISAVALFDDGTRSERNSVTIAAEIEY